MKEVTTGFKMFMEDTEGVGMAFMEAVEKLAQKSALEAKTHELAYLSVLTVARMYGGLPFHVGRAKELGASFEEVRSAILVPMPVIGLQVSDALIIAYESYYKIKAHE